MQNEIIINAELGETRVALLENGQFAELHIERERDKSVVGNVVKGRVSRVLPGMQAAFVDIGLERAAFLHASDIVSERPTTAGDAAATDDTEPAPEPVARVPDNITALVREGQEVLVQVVKDPLGGKGARITTHLSIPSCYLVFMPTGGGVGVSQRIEDEDERLRLRGVARALAEAPGAGFGIIVRTAAERVPDEVLAADLAFVRKLWESLSGRGQTTAAPAIVHEDLPLTLRTLRELKSSEIERIRVDSRESCRRMLDFATQFTPELLPRIEHYAGERPIFDLYNVEEEIHNALDRKVALKSGGHVVIDQTEAMTTVDVNTGAYVGHRNLEETIFKTNLEAAQAIARQLRLRNLGGIIIIDFIDMESEDHQRRVLHGLEQALARDRARTTINGFSALGLVEMTRKRTRESLAQLLSEPCAACNGRGLVKTARSLCYDILREILREARAFNPREFRVIASPQVVELFLDEESQHLAGLSDFVGKPISLQADSAMTQEQYDIVLL